MDDFLVVLVIAALALPVLLIVFMAWVVSLSRRVRVLEDVLRNGAAAPLPQATATPASLPDEGAPAPAPKPKPAAADIDGPWAAAQTEAAKPTAAKTRAVPQPAKAGPPKAVVFRADRLQALTDWLRANWIYAVSAVSLAFAGLFFVQYGIETGILSPSARVIAALAFGAALVGAGEYIRRRWGDRAEATTANLPSVFSGAGIVTLFAAVLAALHLYALIGPGLGFAGLVGVSALSIGLGWYSGPLLAAVGIAGAFAAPFLVGGDSAVPQAFYGYFALVALSGLAIDAGRRWAWVSVLTLVLVYPASWLLYLGAGYPEYYIALLTGLVIAAIAIPELTLAPAHGGAALIESFAKGRPRGWPRFPTRLVAGAMAASSGALALVSLDGAGAFWLALTALAVLVFAVAVWADQAEALEDLAILPAAALLALPILQMIDRGEVYRSFVAVIYAEEGTVVPNDPYMLVAIAALVGLGLAWRSRRGARWPVAWAAGAAFVPPAMVAGLEVTWTPADLLGSYPWALTAIAVAAMMTGLALGFAKADGETKSRTAGFALAALAMIAFALTLVLTKTALTLALAVTTLAAAALDRRFTLRPLSVAVQVGAVALSWRLVLDPGLDWAFDAPYWELILAFGGSIAALAAALYLLRPLNRPVTVAVAESAAWSLGAVFTSVLLARVIDDATPGIGTESHWFVGLLAMVWFAAMAAQLWRIRVGGWLRILRIVLASLYGAIGLLILAVGVSWFNPALNPDSDTLVRGPVLLNTLIPAYLLPALLLGGIAWRFRFLKPALRVGFGVLATGLGVLWLFLAIRHGWRGDAMSGAGFTEPELYSYTIALLVAGAGLLYQAIARRSASLRKIAMAVIGLTVAKVFLVDISGLVGLLRVFSFLALGLALAALAFLNRWAAGQIAEAGGEAGETGAD